MGVIARDLPSYRGFLETSIGVWSGVSVNKQVNVPIILTWLAICFVSTFCQTCTQAPWATGSWLSCPKVFGCLPQE